VTEFEQAGKSSAAHLGEAITGTPDPEGGQAFKCPCCGRWATRRRKWQRCCGRRECQLLYLAFRNCLQAVRAGEAPGLVAELVRAAMEAVEREHHAAPPHTGTP